VCSWLVGVFGGVTGLRDAFCAVDCVDELCSNDAISTGLCTAGYYCEEGSVSPVSKECGASGEYRP
jgi:hypothetical protein